MRPAPHRTARRSRAIDGLIALAAMHAPAAPLPPPTGTMIASMPGSSSSSSSAPVATPAISAARCRSGRSGSRARARAARQCSRASSKSPPWKTSSAPRPRIAATLTGFAFSGTQIVARTPKSRARESDRLAVVAGRRGDHAALALVPLSCETRLTPPRTLNAPVGWWFSCLTYTSRRAARRARRSGRAASAAGAARCAAALRARRRTWAPATPSAATLAGQPSRRPSDQTTAQQRRDRGGARDTGDERRSASRSARPRR